MAKPSDKPNSADTSWVDMFEDAEAKFLCLSKQLLDSREERREEVELVD